MKKFIAIATAVASMVLMKTPGAEANTFNFTGSRYQAMGGTGVAFSDDSLSAYWNPANLAFQKGWDVQIPVTANGEIVNLAAEKLSDLLQRASDMEDLIDQYVDCTGVECSDLVLQPGQTDEIVGFLYDLSRFGKEAESVYLDVEFGILGRYNNFAFSALSMTTATVYPNVDTTNLDLGANPATWIPCDPVVFVCNSPSNAGNQAFQQRLENENPPGWQPDQIGQLIWSMEQLNNGEELNPEQQTVITNVVTSDGAFTDNQSGALAAGLSTQEFGISWSHTIPVPGYEKMEGTPKKIFSYQ